mmetsp:Transcript_168/g.554  ORF Transcript_168/g.554 Transcript_168/m.554 type:complete len:510 (+) Transcript_168:104-1633(+)
MRCRGTSHMTTIPLLLRVCRCRMHLATCLTCSRDSWLWLPRRCAPISAHLSLLAEGYPDVPAYLKRCILNLNDGADPEVPATAPYKWDKESGLFVKRVVRLVYTMPRGTRAADTYPLHALPELTPKVEAAASELSHKEGEDLLREWHEMVAVYTIEGLSNLGDRLKDALPDGKGLLRKRTPEERDQARVRLALIPAVAVAFLAIGDYPVGLDPSTLSPWVRRCLDGFVSRRTGSSAEGPQQRPRKKTKTEEEPADLDTSAHGRDQRQRGIDNYLAKAAALGDEEVDDDDDEGDSDYDDDDDESEEDSDEGDEDGERKKAHKPTQQAGKAEAAPSAAAAAASAFGNVENQLTRTQTSSFSQLTIVDALLSQETAHRRQLGYRMKGLFPSRNFESDLKSFKNGVGRFTGAMAHQLGLSSASRALIWSTAINIKAEDSEGFVTPDKPKGTPLTDAMSTGDIGLVGHFSEGLRNWLDGRRVTVATTETEAAGGQVYQMGLFDIVIASIDEEKE